MEYFLKASAILIIFYVCYIIFLQRETFFASNRWFLILGLITAVLFPLLVIPIYVDATPTSLVGFTMIATTPQSAPDTFNVTTLLIWIYIIGASFFSARLIIQLFSLVVLIKKNTQEKHGHFIYVKTNQDTTPFSFFRWIVYNPNQFNKKELELVLQHEKVHASQRHSMDALLMDLVTALFWCNPFIWLYRKALKQNLEFIADRDTQMQSNCEEHYQKLLLKTCLPQQNLMLINTFYNSSLRLKICGKRIMLFNSFGQVKKRIVMLHKSKSNLMNSWKYSIIVPLLVIFAMTFNTKTIARTFDQGSETPVDSQQNILKFVITKDTKDIQLDDINKKLADKGAIVSFKNVKRNSNDEITAIRINYEYKNTKANHEIKSSEPITSIEVSLNPSDETINVRQQASTLSQTIDITTEASGQTSYRNTGVIATDSINRNKTSYKEENAYHVMYTKTNADPTVKDSIFLERTTDTISWTNAKGENVQIISVKRKNQKTNIFKNDGTSPLVILDGKEITNEEMKAVSPNAIESIQVLKDKSATITYGDKGKNGVILITSKNGTSFTTEDGKIIINLEDDNQKSVANPISNSEGDPLYIMDGKEINKTQMNAIDPNTIDSVDVLKGESATKEYGQKGKNGVIIITLKKD